MAKTALPCYGVILPKSFISTLAFMKFFCLQMNLVDFSFYSAYTLLGPWQPASFGLLSNKALAFGLLTTCVMEVVRLLRNSIYYDKYNSVGLTEIQIFMIEEGMRPKNFDQIVVRLTNFGFHLKLVLFQILLATLQNCSGMCIYTLALLSLLSTVHMIYIVCKYNPFESTTKSVYRVMLELCVLFFFIVLVGIYAQENLSDSSSAHSLDAYTDVLIIFGLLLCIALQFAIVIYDILSKLLSYICRKGKISPEQAQEEAEKSNFASIYMQKVLASKEEAQNKSINSERHKRSVIIPSDRKVQKRVINAPQLLSKSKADDNRIIKPMYDPGRLIKKRDTIDSCGSGHPLRKDTPCKQSDKGSKLLASTEAESIAIPQPFLYKPNPILTALKLKNDKKNSLFPEDKFKKPRKAKINGYSTTNLDDFGDFPEHLMTTETPREIKPQNNPVPAQHLPRQTIMTPKIELKPLGRSAMAQLLSRRT